MRILLILMLVLLWGCVTTSQLPDDTVAPCNIKLYYTLGGLGEDVKNTFNEANFKRILLINQRRIVTKHDQWQVDEDVLGEFLIAQIPDKESSAIIALNWEGEVYTEIKKGPASIHYNRATALFIEAYELVKKLRPNAIVGYYGFPIRDYWNRNQQWRDKNLALDDFLKNFDVLFPSIYDFYDSSTRQGAGDLDYVRENVEEAIAMGQRIGKPVLPFIWHRYHTSNKTKGKELIPLPEFMTHVRTAVATQVKGRAIDGIVWWGSEYSTFAKANLKDIPDKKVLRQTWEREAFVILPKYFEAIQSAVTDSCQN